MELIAHDGALCSLTESSLANKIRLALIEKIWFNNHLLKYLLWPLLWPLSSLFKMDQQSTPRSVSIWEEETYHPPLPVIVVGNITAGGNGKTPVVIWLVEMLQANGFKPGVEPRVWRESSLVIH